MPRAPRSRRPATPAAPALPPPTALWRSRIVGYDEVDPRTLTPHPLNPRRHPANQLAALGGILDELGWLQDIVVNITTGYLLDGHARVEEAIARNQPTVPIKYVELSAAEELLALATFDPVGAMAEVDQDRMRELVAGATEHPAVTSNAVIVDFMASLIPVTAEEPEPPNVEDLDPALLAPQFKILVTCSPIGCIGQAWASSPGGYFNDAHQSSLKLPACIIRHGSCSSTITI